MTNTSMSNTPTPLTGKHGSQLAVPMHDPEMGSGPPDSRCLVVAERAYFK